MSEVHEQEAARAPRVGVHALATAAAGALPVPGLDRYLRALTRGAALRRVASQRGVRLTPDARRILAAPPSASSKRRVAGMLLRRFAAPMRLVARAEDATAVLADAHLLDGYLREAAERGWRRRGAPLDGREARRLRAALDAARRSAAYDALRAAPGGLVGTAREAAQALWKPGDGEDRPPLERLVDTVLDGLAEGPEDVLEALWEGFEDAWVGAGEEGP